MKWQGTRGPLKHLGTLQGRGELLIGSAGQNLGPVTYEIDGFTRRALRSDNGEIEGPADMLALAFRAGIVCIVLADGQCIDIVLSDPRGASRADVRVKDRFPQFDHAV